MSDKAKLRRLLARVVGVATGLITIILVVGILFEVLEGNPDNSLVSASTDLAQFFAGPFDDMFTPSSEELGIAVSWGTAAIVYLIVGRLLAGRLDPS